MNINEEEIIPLISYTPYYNLNCSIEKYKDDIIEFIFDLKMNNCHLGFITKNNLFIKEHFYNDYLDFAFWIEEFAINFKSYMKNCNKITFINCEKGFEYIKNYFN